MKHKSEQPPLKVLVVSSNLHAALYQGSPLLIGSQRVKAAMPLENQLYSTRMRRGPQHTMYNTEEYQRGGGAYYP